MEINRWVAFWVARDIKTSSEVVGRGKNEKTEIGVFTFVVLRTDLVSLAYILGVWTGQVKTYMKYKTGNKASLILIKKFENQN